MNMNKGVSLREGLEMLSPKHLTALHNFLAEQHEKFCAIKSKEVAIPPVKSFDSMVEGVAHTMLICGKRGWGFMEVVHLLEDQDDKVLQAIYTKLEKEPERQAALEREVRPAPVYVAPPARPAKSVVTAPKPTLVNTDKDTFKVVLPKKPAQGTMLVSTEAGEKRVINHLSEELPKPKRLTKKQIKALARRRKADEKAKKQAAKEKRLATIAQKELERAAVKRSRKSSTPAKMATTEQETKMNTKVSTKKVAAKKTPKAAATKNGAKKRFGTGPGFPAEKKITLLAKENPKREGAGAFKRWKLYHNGMTVAAAREAGMGMNHIIADSEHKYIKVG